MATGKTSKRKVRWWEAIIPRQRPLEEWAHVYVTPGFPGCTRYVDADELFARDSVQADLAQMRQLFEDRGGRVEV